jgi:hypothetical protein
MGLPVELRGQFLERCPGFAGGGAVEELAAVRLQATPGAP